MSGIDAPSLIAGLAARARAAATRLASMDSAAKSRALIAAAQAIRADSDAITAANAEDMAAGAANGLSGAMLDRLRLDAGRVEAMAAGVPVVASAVGGVAEIVEDGRTGLLVPPGDVTALTRAIDRVLRDDGELGEAARTTAAEHFSWERNADQTAALYREVVTARKR